MHSDDPLAVLGHEVRNLIATFVGFSELLLSQDWPRETQREYLETMHSEGVRVSQFLNELLDLERLEAGVVELQPRPVDVGALLNFAADVAAHDPRHPVTVMLQEDLPWAMAEPDRVQQVLANLFANARKYSPRGGAIRLITRVARGHIEIAVEDEGVGIPPELLDQVFEKFYRVKSLLHCEVRGSGLGLAICRQIVEAHSGRIWAESEGLGRGARVCFTLPIAPLGAPTSAPGTSRAGVSARSEHVSPHQRDARHSRGMSRPAARRSAVSRCRRGVRDCRYDDPGFRRPTRCMTRRSPFRPSPRPSATPSATHTCSSQRSSTPRM